MHCFSQSFVDKRKGGQLITNRANFAPSTQAVSESSEICVIRDEKGQFQKVTSRYKQGELHEFCAIRVWVFVKQISHQSHYLFTIVTKLYFQKKNKVLNGFYPICVTTSILKLAN